VAKRQSSKPKAGATPSVKEPRIAADPESYLKQSPVWRFGDFDWDGPWGVQTCAEQVANIRGYIQQHLASFETMTWAEILRAAGGRAHGTNSHEIDRGKFKKEVRERLAEKGVLADKIMSLRLTATTRIYGVRRGNCLNFVFFDPDHGDKNKCCYDYGD